MVSQSDKMRTDLARDPCYLTQLGTGLFTLRDTKKVCQMDIQVEIELKKIVLHVHFITIEIGIIGGCSMDEDKLQRRPGGPRYTYTERFNRKARAAIQFALNE